MKLVFHFIHHRLEAKIILILSFRLVKGCTTPDGASGNCINFRFCNRIVNMIVENQQKRDENIENFIRKSICGYDGDDPKVCCAATVAMSSSPAAIILSTSTQSQPGPFIFSAVSPQQNPSTNPPLNTGSQPTFSPLQPSAGNSGNPTISTSPGTFIFGPIGSSSNVPSQPTSPIPTNPVLTNRLPSYDADKCGVSYAVRSRIVGGTNAPRGAVRNLYFLSMNFLIDGNSFAIYFSILGW